METTLHTFDDDGDIPNNGRCPLIAYSNVFDSSPRDMARAFEDLFARHGWRWGWRNGIFPFHHYHSNNHEVLGIAAGSAVVRFGGEGGETLEVLAGDAVLIPAGVGHKRLSSDGALLVIGAYPTATPTDLLREGEEVAEDIRRTIAGVAKPGQDPVGGADGPLIQHWPA